MGVVTFASEVESAYFGNDAQHSQSRLSTDSGLRALFQHLLHSTHRFLCCVQSEFIPAMDPTVRTAPQRSEYGFTSVSRFGSPAELGNEKKTELRIDPFHLPPYGDTLKLINSFFADTGLLFPYIHKESFLNAYLAIKGSDWTKIRRT